jgi:hypothetical protein
MGSIVGSIAGSVLGNVAGSLIGGSAAKKAAGIQADAATYAADLQKEQFDKQIELNAPFREAGLTAQNKLLDYMGLSAGAGGKYAKDFSMADFQQDPGYAFRMSEGLKALDRTAAARGGMLSGGALRGATRYGQDMASQEYTNAFNRYQTNRANQLNPLQSLMGSGQTAAGQVGAAGQAYASNAGNAYMNAADARASGYMGAANSWQNAVTGIGNAYNKYSANQLANQNMADGQWSGNSYDPLGRYS